MLKTGAIKYRLKIEQEVSEGKRGSGYQAICKLGHRPGEDWHRKEVTLPSYSQENLTTLQAANRLAHHFSSISQTVDPLDQTKFHPALKLALEEGKSGYKPVLTQHEIYRKILKVTKPNSSVKGDVPRKLLKIYAFQYAAPVSRIFNKVIKSGQWPRQWVKEYTIVLSKLEKSRSPSSEDNLR